MDKDKIKYDLSMQCALAYVINNKITGDGDIRNVMVDKFHYFWEFYSSMHDSQFVIHTENK